LLLRLGLLERAGQFVKLADLIDLVQPNRLVVVALGINATNALVLSQVVLSIALPIPMIALLIFTQRSQIMGSFASPPLVRIAAWIGTGLVVGLNIILLLQVTGLRLPFPG